MGTSRSRAPSRRGVIDRAMSTLWRRGATESALLLLAAAVASGVVFGAGVARASSHTSAGQTWVARSDTGSVVQINPVTGQPVTEVNVGMPAGRAQVQQGNGVVLVSDPTTGRTVSLDVGRLLVEGSRTDAPGSSKQLFGDGHAYIADLSAGIVRAVDPLSLSDEGQAYSAGAALSDVVVDQAGTVWALRTDGTMTSLRWSDEAGRFIDEGSVRVNGAAAGAKLVPHQRGVTVFAPGSGAVVQVGTGSDVAATVPGMSGQVLAAPSSPQDLSAATVPSQSLAVILSGSDVFAAHLAASGCDNPGQPAVYANRVYVPCAGAGRTVVLGPTGRQAGPDIGSGGNSTPVLTQDEDALVIVEDGGTKAVTVDRQGGTHVADLGADGLPVVVAGTSADTPAADHAVPGGGSPTTAPATPTGSSAGSTAPQQTQQAPQGQDGSVTSVVTSVPSTVPPPGDPGQPIVPAGGPAGSGSSAPDSASGLPGPGPGSDSGSGPATTSTVDSATPPPSGSCVGCGPATDVRAVPDGPGAVRISWRPPAAAPQQYLVQTTTRGELTTADGTGRSVVVSGLVPGTALRFVVGADFGPATVNSFPSNVVVVPGGGPSTTSSPTTTSPTTTSPTTISGSTTSTPPTTSSSSTSTTTSPTTTSTSPTTPTTSSPTTTSPTTPTTTSPTTPTTTSPTSPTTTSPTTTTPTTTTPTSTSPPLVKDPPVVGLSVHGSTHSGGCCSPDAASVLASWNVPEHPQSAPLSYTVTVTGGETSPITVTGVTNTSQSVSVGTSGSVDKEFTVTVTVTAVYADGSSPGVSGTADILLAGKQCFRDPRTGQRRCVYP